MLSLLHAPYWRFNRPTILNFARRPRNHPRLRTLGGEMEPDQSDRPGEGTAFLFSRIFWPRTGYRPRSTTLLQRFSLILAPSRASLVLAPEGSLWQEPPACRDLLGRFFGYRACCRSSVVEHSIGNGEVDSSILSGSTSYRLEIAKLSLIHFADELRASPKGTTP